MGVVHFPLKHMFFEHATVQDIIGLKKPEIGELVAGRHIDGSVQSALSKNFSTRWAA